MGMKFKKADGRIFYLPSNINCNKFRTILDKDGFFKKVICRARKKKPECRKCSLNKRS